MIEAPVGHVVALLGPNTCREQFRSELYAAPRVVIHGSLFNFMMKKTQADRIYIFVPRKLTVYTRGQDVEFTMPNGRAAAQCAHVAARLVEAGTKDVSEMTTIILAATDSNHLAKIFKIVMDWRLPVMTQFDTFEGFNNQVLQAIAIGPLTEKESRVFKLSELW